MKLPFFWIDAFTAQPFRGNPAGVCPLTEWLPDEILQRMAFEHGLSETAFLVPKGPGRYHLRWFTPAVEVNLCGHATLASAHVILRELKAATGSVVFDTKSGPLGVAERGQRLEMDFPERVAQPHGPLEHVTAAVGAAPRELRVAGNHHLFVYERESDVARLRPDFAALRGMKDLRVIATAPGEDCDFVSRYFASSVGIDEDPVTGSAHCTLVPYWCERLGRKNVHARQISARGGELWCEWASPRVKIAGQAVCYLKGEISV
ncbi:isomerase [Opitutaceae bacterium EW11]|nr:isomerase [Opitutaceae bacterium EW11]